MVNPGILALEPILLIIMQESLHVLIPFIAQIGSFGQPLLYRKHFQAGKEKGVGNGYC